MLNTDFPWTLEHFHSNAQLVQNNRKGCVCNYEKDRTLELVKCICAHAHVKIIAALWIFFLIIVVNTGTVKMSHVHV